MQFEGKTIRVSELEDGIYQIQFDVQGFSVNVLNNAVFDELSLVVKQLSELPDIKGCIFSSAKSVFIAGAEIPTLVGAVKGKTMAETEELVAYGQTLFHQIQALPCVTVSAINGFALGGGCELTLATDIRVMFDEARIGLPEVTLGVFPGWGATVRLPRMIAPEEAMQWFTSGEYKTAEAAAKAGLVADVVTDLNDLLPSALAQVKRNQGNFNAIRDKKSAPLELTEQTKQFIEQLQAKLAKRPGVDYPAASKALDCMVEHAPLNLLEASKIETKRFAEIIRTDTAQNLLHVFLNDQAVAKIAKKYAKSADKVASAAVIGAGIMGGGIVYQSALKKVPVVMKDIHQQALDLGLQEASNNFDALIKKGRLDVAAKQQALQRITLSLESSDLSHVDMVVEAVVENTQVKKSVLADLENQVKDAAIIVSNTSTISITRLAEDLQRPEQFCGMHFFNPVPLMPLVEVIRGENSSDETISKTVGYALQLGKKPVVVNDCPAFLVNRVLFPYLNASHMLIEEGVDFQQLDQVMEEFGWPMGPALLSDVIGMDTLSHCLDVLAQDLPERMAMPFVSAAHKLHNTNRLGQKSGKGYYQFVTNQQGRLEKTLDQHSYDLLYDNKPSQTDPVEIEQRLMVASCLETVRCLEEGVVNSPSEADMAVLWGLGFPRFRGGFLRHIDTVGIEQFCLQAEQYRHLGAMYELPTLLKDKRAQGQTFY